MSGLAKEKELKERNSLKSSAYSSCLLLEFTQKSNRCIIVNSCLCFAEVTKKEFKKRVLCKVV